MDLNIFKFIPAGAEGHSRGSCDACGKAIWSEGALRVPGIPGLHCSVACIETSLFGTDRCRWCGSDMDKPYTSVDSRLCTEDCSTKYYTHVCGERAAALGTGYRFVRWLQLHRPEIYAQFVGGNASRTQMRLAA